MQGHDGTKFMKELRAGDAIVIKHPTTLCDETRLVKMVLSVRGSSLTGSSRHTFKHAFGFSDVMSLPIALWLPLFAFAMLCRTLRWAFHPASRPT